MRGAAVAAVAAGIVGSAAAQINLPDVTFSVCLDEKNKTDPRWALGNVAQVADKFLADITLSDLKKTTEANITVQWALDLSHFEPWAIEAVDIAWLDGYGSSNDLDGFQKCGKDVISRCVTSKKAGACVSGINKVLAVSNEHASDYLSPDRILHLTGLAKEKQG